MYGMQYIQQTIVGIDGSEARFFGYVADNSEEMEPDRIRPAILILPGGGYAMTSDREAEPVALQFLAKASPYSCCAIRCSPAAIRWLCWRLPRQCA